MTTIIGVKLDNRTQTAIDFQAALTKHGCVIKTRLGLHETSEETCSSNGIVILELLDGNRTKEFEMELEKIEGISKQKMKF